MRSPEDSRSGPSVLVLGASGLLGSHLIARLPHSFPTSAPPPRHGGAAQSAGVRWLPVRVEVSDRGSVMRAIALARPDVIVNAIGITPQSAALADPELMHAVNARFPHELARLAEACGARVVHVSSDAVFSGARGEYSETDAPDPSTLYGRSKLAGEIGAPHLTIRTSFFGRSPNGRGLVEWLLTQRNRVIEGYVDYVFSGMAAASFAELVAKAIGTADLEGVYHAGGGPLTKFDLLRALAEALDVPVTVTPARRGPVNRSLDSSRFFGRVGVPRPSLDDMLATLRSCVDS